MVEAKVPVLTDSFDAFAREHGWLLLSSTDLIDVAAFDTLFVFGAVPWSEWDLKAARALAGYLAHAQGVAVVIFNMDDEPAGNLRERRFPQLAAQPYAVPVVAMYHGGHLERVEQGYASVTWLESLANA